MAAYASPPREPEARVYPSSTSSLSGVFDGGTVLEQFLERVADRVASAVADRLTPTNGSTDEWFDSRHAAVYLGVHHDTLRKLAAERSIPSEQDGPGCKLYFRRSDLDAWRRSGGRPWHVRAQLAAAA